MRFLADENFPGLAVETLRNHGWDVIWVRTDCPGITDREVLSRAQTDNRILLTFDKDFGELAYRCGLPAGSGIILFRISLRSPSAVTQIVVAALASRSDWTGHFSVVEANRIRMSPLPGVT